MSKFLINQSILEILFKRFFLNFFQLCIYTTDHFSICLRFRNWAESAVSVYFVQSWEFVRKVRRTFLATFQSLIPMQIYPKTKTWYKHNNLMPFPFTWRKMFCAGPNFLCWTKNLFTYCASHKHFVPEQKMICIQ